VENGIHFLNMRSVNFRPKLELSEVEGTVHSGVALSSADREVPGYLRKVAIITSQTRFVAFRFTGSLYG
jgi:hypothetical protein